MRAYVCTGLLALLLVGPLAVVQWSGDDAIAVLRARLRTRGFADTIASGPMLAIWADDAPRDPMASVSGIPSRDQNAGAYLVLTDAGSWWLWPGGADQGPLVERPPLLD